MFGSKPKTIKLKINEQQIEEVTLNPKDDLSEMLGKIASQNQTIAPSTDEHVIFVMGNPSLLVPWATLCKNLLKEQLNLEMKPYWIPNKSKFNAMLKPKVRTEKSDVTDRVFGGRLEQHYYLDDDNNTKRYLKLPPIIFKLFEFLTSDRAVRSVGLFRILGSVGQTQQLVQQFNAKQKANENFNSIVFDNTTDPNIVANLLKEYLKELQLPLLHPTSTFLEIARLSDANKRQEEFMKAFKNLEHNIYRRVFRELIEVLNEFLHYSHLNKLNSRVLSLSIGPYLFQQHKDQSITAKSTNAELYYNIIGMCMENFEQIFLQGYDFNALEGGFTADDSQEKRSGNTLASFLEKMRDKGGASTASNSFLNNTVADLAGVERKEVDTNSATSSSSSTVATTSSEHNVKDDATDIQDRWREYVESWKQKYKQEKEEYDKAQQELEEIVKAWQQEKKELEEEMQKLKLSISSSDITEDDEIKQLDDEKRKLLKDIDRERDRFKFERESHDEKMKKIKRRQLLALKKMGIESLDETNTKLSPEFFKLKRQQENRKQTARGIDTSPTPNEQSNDNSQSTVDPLIEEEENIGSASSLAGRTTVGGGKIQVNDRFKKKK
ncbi:rho GTPase activating protein [Naegleria gruberi]|uniref:Rho GTPase activating protein n=1 Tax=Naegleria gruberi TaxID=5762 RepID=D2UYI3_NAEGR|nr:rho GTPase activating protein [Naegleria gruberi]EFC50797.1 rho GTPase activating protein [Naegleria gruberi]|eukprot:XP_002683541.1 rho GTPase activating protein [Naegleria gruberi strain NEG-M]